MTHPVKPNTWIDIHADGNTRLTYALQTNPAPLTVSVPDQSAEIASLQFVVTNPTNGPITIETITFTLEAGTSGASITPSTDGVLTQVSDTVNWNVTKPGVVTSGPAPYVLGPAAGPTVTLAAGASVVVEIYQMQTVQTPGTSTITVKEMLPGAPPTFASFLVTTFPDGFYFNGLIATVPQGSGLVPVAEIDNNGTSNVTLVWNSSVTETTAFSILYSSAASGQQTATPTEVGQWTSPPLTSDTVFTVSVTVAMTGGQPLTAAQSTAVSVQNPALIASSITAGTATVAGNATVDGTLTTGTATVTGNATVDQQLTAASAVIGGAGGLNVNQNGHVNIGSMTAGGAVIESSDPWQTELVIQNDSVGKAFQFLVGGSGNNSGAAGVGGFGVYDSAFEGFRFNLNANGNVGIGTTAPTSKLHIHGDYQNTGAGGFTLDAFDGAMYCLKINPFVIQSNSVGYQFQTTSFGNGVLVPLTICDSGNVGIGTTTPIAPLHVGFAVSMTHSLQDQYTFLGYQWNNSGPNEMLWGMSDRYGNQFTYTNTAICAEGRVVATEFDAFSDERIKLVRGRSDSAADLQTMLGIEVTDYRYRDVVKQGNAPHKKLIAQQVEKVFPEAVSLTTGSIPDICCQADLADGWVNLATDLKAGERVRLVCNNIDAVYEVIEAGTDRFCVKTPPAGEKVFVYGREVDDFRTVDYDAISMLHLSATQQLKRDTDQAINLVRSECDELRSVNLDLIKRLEALERRMGSDAKTISKAVDTAGH